MLMIVLAAKYKFIMKLSLVAIPIQKTVNKIISQSFFCVKLIFKQIFSQIFRKVDLIPSILL